MITRWGTFLEAAEFHIHNWDEIKEWIEELDSGSEAVSTLKQLVGWFSSSSLLRRK